MDKVEPDFYIARIRAGRLAVEVIYHRPTGAYVPREGVIQRIRFALITWYWYQMGVRPRVEVGSPVLPICPDGHNH